MGVDAVTTKLDGLHLNQDDGIKECIYQFFGDVEKLGDNGLNRLLKLLQQRKISKLLYECMIDDVNLTINQLKKLGDTNGKILINILQGNSDANMIQHVLNTLKQNVKRALNAVDIKFYLQVYFNVISTFRQYNVQHLLVFLPLLNPNLYDDINDIKPLIILISITLLKYDAKLTTAVISDYLDINFNIEDENLSVNQYLHYIEVLEVYFPLIPELIAPIYLESSKRHIDCQISKITNPEDIKLYRQIVVATSKLFSSSCINNDCRQFNFNNYFKLILLATKVDDQEIKIMANLIIIKLWNFVQVEQNITKDSLTNNLLNYVADHKKNDDQVLLESAIEGLAYLSLNKEVKHLIRINETTLEILISLLSENKSSSLNYGIMVILNNVSSQSDPNEKSQKKTVEYLKNVSLGNAVDNFKESQIEIELFNKSLLCDHKIVSVVSRLKANEASTNKLMALIINIIYLIALNKEKVVKIELVKQGSLKLIMNYLVKNSTVAESTGETRPLNDDDDRLIGIRALAKIMYTVNPALASNNFDIRSTIPFLVELLGPNISNYKGLQLEGKDSYLSDSVTNIDKFESLLALTNISSLENSDLKRFIISKVFDNYLNNFILDSDHPKIQIASWELISNLINEPTLLVKFFNVDETTETKENAKRLDLLIKLLDSESEELQIVLAGLLANATSESMICQVLLSLASIRMSLLKKFTTIFLNQYNNGQLILRVSYTFSNLVYFALNAKQMSKLLDDSLIKSIKQSISLCKDKESCEVLQDVLKYLN